MRVLPSYLLVFAVLSVFGRPSQAAYPQLIGTDLRDGKSIALTIAADRKALAIVFLSAKCPCSQDHEPVLARLAAKYPDVAFVGVHSNRDENVELARDHFAKARLPFAVIQDADGALADRYGALKTPHLFLVNAAGETLYQGGVDDSRRVKTASRHYLADALEAVRAGRRPKVSQARALGCMIAR